MYFNKQPIKAVLFDLDGTLLDTATDLGHALNNVLTKRSLTPLSQTLIRPAAGRGCRGLLKAGMDIDEAHPEYKQLCTELLALSFASCRHDAVFSRYGSCIAISGRK
jgi:phosphoglycolate phosphatase-like HAD superfamily hydrolase